MKTKPLYSLGLREASFACSKRKIRSEDLTRTLLQRISEHEATVQAFQWMDPSKALNHARKSDETIKSGIPSGQLHGIGIGIKDIIETRGIPTTMGSPVYKDYIPGDSATVVKRLEDAGAFVMGKTVTTEFAYFTPGKTRNPWNQAHTPGGSSSGSASAVAMGFVPGAIGTQTNGSVIRPAAFCGVVGYKPTAGIIPLDGIHPFSPSLDQVGVFTRDVPDASFLAAVLQTKEPLPGCKTIPAISSDVNSMSHPPRLAAIRSPVWHRAEENAQRHFESLIKKLREKGAVVEELELPEEFDQAHALLRTIMYAEAAKTFAELQHRYGNLLSARLKGLIDEGLEIKESDLERSFSQKETLSVNIDDFMNNFDAAVTPPTPGEAPAGLTQTGDPVFCTIWSLCGVPAINIPAGLGPKGLPLGLQIVGPRFSDDRVLSAAKWCDEVIGWTRRIAA
jgi:Asp-tRNA(Asn)/Glu-tRNA(Gln) amidotransferase A subunit family amidase